MPEWKSEFQPKQGYWIRQNENLTETLVWISETAGVWHGATEDGSPSGFRIENGCAVAEGSCLFKGPYIW